MHSFVQAVSDSCIVKDKVSIVVTDDEELSNVFLVGRHELVKDFLDFACFWSQFTVANNVPEVLDLPQTQLALVGYHLRPAARSLLNTNLMRENSSSTKAA